MKARRRRRDFGMATGKHLGPANCRIPLIRPEMELIYWLVGRQVAECWSKGENARGVQGLNRA